MLNTFELIGLGNRRDVIYSAPMALWLMMEAGELDLQTARRCIEWAEEFLSEMKK